MDAICDSMENLTPFGENEEISKWVKNLNLNEDGVHFKNYNNKKYFKEIGKIILDDETTYNGSKKRKTLIKLETMIEEKEYSSDKNEWIYILTINGEIVKIGGTANGLKKRMASYLCGHHTQDRGRSGKCSVTNAYVYNTLYHHLKIKNNIIKMYGYLLPKKEIKINVLGKNKNVYPQTYHLYEADFIENFVHVYGKFPQLSKNFHKRSK